MNRPLNPSSISHLLFAIIAWGGFLLPTPASAHHSLPTCETITMSGPPNAPPVVWTDYLSIHGAAHDLLERVFSKHGIVLTTDHIGGYPRVLKAFHRGRIQLILGLPKNLETEATATFLKRPLYTHSLAVLVRKDGNHNPHQIPESWNDLLKMKGAMPDQLSIDDIFGNQQPKHLMRTFSPKHALKMLSVGRVDYTIYPNIQDDLMVSLLNMEGQYEKLPLISNKIPVHAAFSKNMDCSLPLDEINKDLASLEASGEAEAILNDSLYKWMSYQLNRRGTN